MTPNLVPEVERQSAATGSLGNEGSALSPGSSASDSQQGGGGDGVPVPVVLWDDNPSTVGAVWADANIR